MVDMLYRLELRIGTRHGERSKLIRYYLWQLPWDYRPVDLCAIEL